MGNRKPQARVSTLSRSLMLALAVAAGATAPLAESRAQTPPAASAVEFDIPAGDLATAIDRFAEQSGLQVVSQEALPKRQVPALRGRHAPEEALRRLLQGSGVEFERLNGRTFVLKKVQRKSAKPRPEPRAQAAPAAAEEDVKNMPAIMVTKARSLNMDIVRTEDDPQPYVVFDREQIERSGATSLEQFLQQRLTMNTSPANAGAGTGTTPGIATSQITLRGLSAAQTLILVDGHRVSSPAFSGSGQGTLSQADITGLPLGAIERIEVLPTTASGIYGGSASGGVINIILRRDYSGGEARFTYDNTFDTDTAGRRIDATFGHHFNQGRTSLMVTANYAEANELLMGNRHFAQHGRGAIWRNNPGYFLGPTGRPPLGATPNITSVDGSNLVLKPAFGGGALNAAFTSVPEGYAGVGADGGAALIANAGRYNWELANTAQSDSSSGGSRQALYTQPRIKSGAVILRHQVNDRLQIFADLSSSRSVSRFPTSSVVGSFQIPASSPTNPFAQAIRVAVPLASEASEYATTIDHHRALAGLVWQFPHDWLLGADVTWNRTTVHNQYPDNASTFTAAVTTGAVDVLRDTTAFPIDLAPYIGQGDFSSPFRSTMTDVNLRASGPIGQLPGGPLMLSASAAHRDESVADAFWFGPTSSTFYYPERSQTVTSTYLELRTPLFSKRNSRPGLRELDLQLAVRRDDYTSRSGELLLLPASSHAPSTLPEAIRRRSTFVSTDPTVALRWKPWNSLALRASYGTGFVPPGLDQLVPTIQPGTLEFGTDPLRGGNAAGPYTYVTGGNADLDPEQSESWSAGLVLTPTALPNWRVSVDYTRIEKTDNIAFHPGFIQGLIDDEALFPGRIVRGPSLPGDPPGWAGPITQVDNSLLNLASAMLEAWDVQLDYKKHTERYGTFDFFFLGTWQPHFRVRTIEGQSEVEHVGISSGNPLKFKASAGATWTRAAWRLGWNLQHFDAYQVSSNLTLVNNQGNSSRIPSQTYHDVFVRYDFGLREGNVLPGWLSGIEAQFGIRNLFDKAPPFDASNLSGFYSRFADPRRSSYYVTVVARF